MGLVGVAPQHRHRQNVLWSFPWGWEGYTLQCGQQWSRREISAGGAGGSEGFGVVFCGLLRLTLEC